MLRFVLFTTALVAGCATTPMLTIGGTPAGSFCCATSHDFAYNSEDVEVGDWLRVNAMTVNGDYLVYSSSLSIHCDLSLNGQACTPDSNGMGGGDYLCEVAE